LNGVITKALEQS
jgi:hypothetical protein